MTPVDALAATQPAEVDPIAARIAHIRVSCPAGWGPDGDGVPTTDAALETAQSIARIVAACGQAPHIFPRVEGGATVECDAVDVWIGEGGVVESVATGDEP